MIASRPGARAREFEIGGGVMVRSYGQGKEKWMKGVVLERKGPLSYRVEVEEGVVRRHVDQIRRDARSEMDKIGENLGAEQAGGIEMGVAGDNHAIPDVVVTSPELVTQTTDASSNSEGVVETALEPVGEGEMGQAVSSATQSRNIAQDRPRRNRSSPKWMGDYV